MIKEQNAVFRILIVDQEGTLPVAVREQGHLCDCVSDAGACIEMLRLSQYGLLIISLRVLSDIQKLLPSKVSDLIADARVILISGKYVPDSPIDLARLRLCSYVTGLVAPEQLIAHVKAVIAEGRASCNDDLLQARTPRAAELSIGDLISLACRNVSNSVLDLKHLADAFAAQGADIGKQGVCHLFHCPRLARLTAALRETVDALESTKSSFKSKELGDLRKKLETLLKGVDEDNLTI